MSDLFSDLAVGMDSIPTRPRTGSAADVKVPPPAAVTEAPSATAVPALGLVAAPVSEGGAPQSNVPVLSSTYDPKPAQPSAQPSSEQPPRPASADAPAPANSVTAQLAPSSSDTSALPATSATQGSATLPSSRRQPSSATGETAGPVSSENSVPRASAAAVPLETTTTEEPAVKGAPPSYQSAPITSPTKPAGGSASTPMQSPPPKHAPAATAPPAAVPSAARTGATPAPSTGAATPSAGPQTTPTGAAATPSATATTGAAAAAAAPPPAPAATTRAAAAPVPAGAAAAAAPASAPTAPPVPVPAGAAAAADPSAPAAAIIPVSLEGGFAQAKAAKDKDAERKEDKILEESPQGRFHKFDEVLGKGAFKTVHKAYDSLEGCEVAWNTVKLVGVPEDEKKRIINEVRLLYTLKHENILEFRGTWVNKKGENGDEIIFITEILGAGSLKQFMKKVKVIRWKVVKRWVRDILKGLVYLHSLEPVVIHRDLKCDNVFINGQRGDLRIGDLGLSRRKDMAEKGKMALTLAGTPAFMAPEFYTEQYDEKVDIYALGMSTLEMLTKEYPYQECASAGHIMKLVMEGTPPKSLDRVILPVARDFITLCLQHDPKLRPPAAELAAHPFLQPGGPEDDVEIKLQVNTKGSGGLATLPEPASSAAAGGAAGAGTAANNPNAAPVPPSGPTAAEVAAHEAKLDAAEAASKAATLQGMQQRRRSGHAMTPGAPTGNVAAAANEGATGGGAACDGGTNNGGGGGNNRNDSPPPLPSSSSSSSSGCPTGAERASTERAAAAAPDAATAADAAAAAAEGAWVVAAGAAVTPPPGFDSAAATAAAAAAAADAAAAAIAAAAPAPSPPGSRVFSPSGAATSSSTHTTPAPRPPAADLIPPAAPAANPHTQPSDWSNGATRPPPPRSHSTSSRDSADHSSSRPTTPTKSAAAPVAPAAPSAPHIQDHATVQSPRPSGEVASWGADSRNDGRDDREASNQQQPPSSYAQSYPSPGGRRHSRNDAPPSPSHSSVSTGHGHTHSHHHHGGSGHGSGHALHAGMFSVVAPPAGREGPSSVLPQFMALPGASQAGYKYDFHVLPTAAGAETETTIEVEIEVAIHGEIQIVSFPFDFVHEAVESLAVDLCESFDIPEAVPSIQGILVNIKEQAAAQAAAQHDDDGRTSLENALRDSGSVAPATESSTDTRAAEASTAAAPPPAAAAPRASSPTAADASANVAALPAASTAAPAADTSAHAVKPTIARKVHAEPLDPGGGGGGDGSSVNSSSGGGDDSKVAAGTPLSNDEASALQVVIEKETKHDAARVRRLDKLLKDAEKEEEERRAKYAADLVQMTQKRDKEQRILEERQRTVEADWRAGRAAKREAERAASVDDAVSVVAASGAASGTEVEVATAAVTFASGPGAEAGVTFANEALEGVVHATLAPLAAVQATAPPPSVAVVAAVPHFSSSTTVASEGMSAAVQRVDPLRGSSSSENLVSVGAHASIVEDAALVGAHTAGPTTVAPPAAAAAVQGQNHARHPSQTDLPPITPPVAPSPHRESPPPFAYVPPTTTAPTSTAAPPRPQKPPSPHETAATSPSVSPAKMRPPSQVPQQQQAWPPASPQHQHPRPEQQVQLVQQKQQQLQQQQQQQQPQHQHQQQQQQQQMQQQMQQQPMQQWPPLEHNTWPEEAHIQQKETSSWPLPEHQQQQQQQPAHQGHPWLEVEHQKTQQWAELKWKS